MTIGTPESFRGGQGLVEWLLVILVAVLAIGAICIWRFS
jgi:hypothetical protein